MEKFNPSLLQNIYFIGIIEWITINLVQDYLQPDLKLVAHQDELCQKQGQSLIPIGLCVIFCIGASLLCIYKAQQLQRMDVG